MYDNMVNKKMAKRESGAQPKYKVIEIILNKKNTKRV